MIKKILKWRYFPSAKEECEKYRGNYNLRQCSFSSCKKYQWNQQVHWDKDCRIPESHSCLPRGVGKSHSVLRRSPLLSVRGESTVWAEWDEEVITFGYEVAHMLLYFGRDVVNFALSFAGGETWGQVSNNDCNDPFSSPWMLELLSPTFSSLHPSVHKHYFRHQPCTLKRRVWPTMSVDNLQSSLLGSCHFSR